MHKLVPGRALFASFFCIYFSDKNAGNISVYKKITRETKRARGHFAQREKGLKRAAGRLKMTVALQSRYRKGGDLGFKNLLCKQCLFS
jgi:hypothetical protein